MPRRKKYFLGVAIAVILLASLYFISQKDSLDSKEDYDKANAETIENFEKLGQAKKRAVEVFLKEEKKLQSGRISIDEIEYIGSVQGEKISKNYYAVRYASYRAIDAENKNSKLDAWNTIKMEVYKRHFAEQHNIMPTVEDIKEYTKSLIKDFEEMEGNLVYVEAYASGMGMTLEQYWEYNQKYEAPLALIDSNVAEYMAAHGLTMPEPDDIEGEITDMKYFESLE